MSPLSNSTNSIEQTNETSNSGGSLASGAGTQNVFSTPHMDNSMGMTGSKNAFNDNSTPSEYQANTELSNLEMDDLLSANLSF